MSVDVSTLEIRVVSDAVEQANRRLNALERQGGQTERATDGLTAAFGKMLVPLAGAVSVMAGFEKLVNVTREFDVLNAGLITATGSAANASKAFEALQQFAATTPYDLQQVTEAFTGLRVRGLDASTRALTSYGNTAAAMGKDLKSVYEAVADASTGEFERVKEAFGLSYKNLGDTVAFTFAGVTTTVEKNSEAIQQYLVSIGENNFATAMTERMKTLDGAISNLGDTWNKLFLDISNAGVGDLVVTYVRKATAALEDLDSLLKSGELEGYLKNIAHQMIPIGIAGQQAASIVAEAFRGAFDLTREDASKTGDAVTNFLTFSAKNLPTILNEAGQAIGTWLAHMVNVIGIYAQRGVDEWKMILTAGLNGDSFDAMNQRRTEALDRENTLYEQVREGIRSASAAQIDKNEVDFASIQLMREKYDLSMKMSVESLKLSDPLAGGGKGSPGGVTGSASGSTKSKKEKKSREKAGPDDDASAVESLEYELQQEEELLSVSYARRFEQRTIWDALNDEAASTSFSRKMEQWAQEEQYKQEMDAREYQENEQHFVKTQKQLVGWLEKGKITKERFEQLSALNGQKYNKNKEQLDKQSQTTQLGNASIFAGAALNIATTLFSDNKGVAIASALMSTYQGAAQAMKDLPYPANLAAAATVVASGIAQVQNIRSTNVGGGGGGSSAAIPSIPSTITNGFDSAASSTLPTTTAQETPVTRTVYLNIESNGKPMADDSKVEFSSVRQMIDVINEEIKMGNVRLVL